MTFSAMLRLVSFINDLQSWYDIMQSKFYRPNAAAEHSNKSHID